MKNAGRACNARALGVEVGAKGAEVGAGGGIHDREARPNTGEKGLSVVAASLPRSDKPDFSAVLKFTGQQYQKIVLQTIDENLVFGHCYGLSRCFSFGRCTHHDRNRNGVYWQQQKCAGLLRQFRLSCAESLQVGLRVKYTPEIGF